MSENPNLTVADVAQIRRVTTKTVHNWIKSGALRAYYIGPGKTIRIAESDLNALLRPVREVQPAIREVERQLRETSHLLSFGNDAPAGDAA